MVAALRSLMVLLLAQVLLGGAAGLIPEVGRRKYSQQSGRGHSPEQSGRGHSPQRSEGFLRDFELRLLNMFGLRRRPTPGRGAVVPDYMVDLYRMHSANGDHSAKRPPSMGRHAERAASRANTIRSFHHQGAY